MVVIAGGELDIYHTDIAGLSEKRLAEIGNMTKVGAGYISFSIMNQKSLEKQV